MTGLILVLVLTSQRSIAQATSDTLQEEVMTLNDKVNGIGERLATAESDLAKLTKLKISGYIQAQWQWTQDHSQYPANFLTLRRTRIKFTYEPLSGVVFVLQPDFSPAGVTIKDAYGQVNDPWIKTFALTAGQFNRPDYEVEYSSSMREVPERSRVIRALYPNERAIGVMLTVAPPKIPLKIQMDLMNGNDGLVIKDAAGIDINPKNTDFDNFKDLMTRATYGFKLGNFGSLDIGATYYYGFIKATTTEVLNSEYQLDKTVAVGKSLNRNWFGAELQLYMDVLGGMAIKGEFLMGQNAFPGYSSKATVTNPVQTLLSGDTLTMNNITTTTTKTQPNIVRNFMGYYIYLTKNIGKRNEFAIRYDYYDPNTKLNGDQIGVVKYDNSSSQSTTDSKVSAGGQTIIVNNTTTTKVTDTYSSGTADIAYGTITAAWSYFFSDNIKFMLAYEYPINQKVGVNPATGTGNVTQSYTVNDVKGVNDYSTVFPQSMVTVRLQVKF